MSPKSLPPGKSMPPIPPAEAVTGALASVTFIPGRLDIVWVELLNDPSSYVFCADPSLDPACKLNVNGMPVGAPTWLNWIAHVTASVVITLHPDPHHYGLSLVTDFVSSEVHP